MGLFGKRHGPEKPLAAPAEFDGAAAIGSISRLLDAVIWPKKTPGGKWAQRSG